MTREGKVGVHASMPKELFEQIDALVGPRRRSEFVTEAVQKELARRNRSEMGRRIAQSLADAGLSDWESGETTAEWVHRQRYHPGALGPVDCDCDR